MERHSRGTITYLVPASLKKTPFILGFTAKPTDFSKRNRGAIAAEFLACFGITSLALVDQVHGTTIHTLAGSASSRRGICVLGEGDAIWISDTHDPSLRGSCAGILTADCTPVALSVSNAVVLIHAGWRGLAAGIIEKGLGLLASHSGNLSVVIGPCAGAHRYEVGEEVIQALGERAECAPVKGTTKFLLSMPGTVKKIVESHWRGEWRFEESGVCTISSSEFHSHRRDGERAGRNLMFCLFPQNDHSAR